MIIEDMYMVLILDQLLLIFATTVGLVEDYTESYGAQKTFVMLVPRLQLEIAL